jgi:hypothetical protein
MLLDSKKIWFAGLPSFVSLQEMHLQCFDCGFAGQSIEASYIKVLINALSLCVHSGLPGDNCRCTGS